MKIQGWPDLGTGELTERERREGDRDGREREEKDLLSGSQSGFAESSVPPGGRHSRKARATRRRTTATLVLPAHVALLCNRPAE